MRRRIGFLRPHSPGIGGMARGRPWAAGKGSSLRTRSNEVPPYGRSAMLR